MIAAAIAKLLADNGFGTLEVEIFEDRMPAHPTDAICVASGDGGVPVTGLCALRANDAAFFLVEVRRNSQSVARDDAYAVYSFLDGITNYGLSGFSTFEEISARYPFRLRREVGEPQGVVFAVSGEAIIHVP